MMNPLQSRFGAALPGSAVHARPFAAARGPVFARPPADGFAPGGGGTGLVRSAASPQLVTREQRLRAYLGGTAGVGHSVARRTFDVAVQDVPRIVVGGLLIFPGGLTVVGAVPLAMLLANLSPGPDHGKIGYVMLGLGVPVLGYMLLQSGWHAVEQHWTSDDRAIEKLRNPATHLNVAWLFYERLRNGYGGLSMPQRVAFVTAIVERIRSDGLYGNFANRFFGPGVHRDFLLTVAPKIFEGVLIEKASVLDLHLSEYAVRAIADLFPEFSPANRASAIEALFSNMAFEAREGYFNRDKAQSLGAYARGGGDEALLTRLVTLLTALQFGRNPECPGTPDGHRLEALQTALRYHTMSDAGPITPNDQTRARLVAQALREWRVELRRTYGPEAWVAGRRASKLWAQLDQWAEALEQGQRIPKSATGLRSQG